MNTNALGGFSPEIIYKKILSLVKKYSGNTLDIEAGKDHLSLRLKKQGNKEVFACDKYNFVIQKSKMRNTI